MPFISKLLCILINMFILKIADAIIYDNSSSITDAGITYAEELIQNIRLPDQLLPIHYTLEIQPFLSPDFSYNGMVDIEFFCKKSTKSIILHAKDLQIDTEQFYLIQNDEPSTQFPILQWGFSERNDFMVLYLGKDLEKDHVYTLSISFSGEITDQFTGFFKSSYKDDLNTTHWLAYTQFHPIEPRKVFPCFDEPALKATFDIIIVRPKDMISLSNMEISKSESRDENWIADYYETTSAMPTHQVSFMICDFQVKLKTSKSGINIKAWAPKHMIDQVESSLQFASKLVMYYENYFSIYLPIKKIDIIPVFESPEEGMASLGQITLKDSILLHYSEFGDNILSAVILARELCHQWFGNLVTPIWWNDIWFSKGFATYMAYKAVGIIKPEWQMEEYMISEEIHFAMDADVSRFSQPISKVIEDPKEMSDYFDKYLLSKAASIIRNLNTILGEKTFRQGIQTFLMNWTSECVPIDVLWQELTKESTRNGRNVNIKVFMDSWISQGGFPVVTISRNPTEAFTYVTQERFTYQIPKFNYDSKHGHSGSKWEVPVTFLNEASSKNGSIYKLLWLRKENVTIDGLLLPLSKWIIVNINVSGFYISNYDRENWHQITKQLNENHEEIHNDKRLQIINDAFQLARAGILNYHTALDLVRYVEKEQDYYVWLMIINNLKRIAIRFQNLCIHRVIAKHYVQKSYHIYKTLGWEENQQENILTRKQRDIILSDSCYFGLKECVTQAKAFFKQWKENILYDDFSQQQKYFIILCNGVRYGNEDDWKSIFDKYIRASNNKDKQLYLMALACSRKRERLERLLNYTLTDVIDPQQKINVFRHITKEYRGTRVAWDFFRNKFRTIKEKYGTNANLLIEFLMNMVKHFRYDTDIKELEMFTSVYINEFDWESNSFKKMLEAAYQSVTWFQRSSKMIFDWFKINTNGGDIICTEEDKS